MVDASIRGDGARGVGHTNEREVVGSLIDALQFHGFGEVSVAPAEPTIDDVFVSLVSSQRATPSYSRVRGSRRRPQPAKAE